METEIPTVPRRDLASRHETVTQANIREVEQDDQKVIETLFEGFCGRFLSIGANNGDDHTKTLIERGWNAVYVEPDPQALVALLDGTEKFKSQVQIVQSAVTVKGGLQKLYSATNNSFCSSFKGDWLARSEKWAPESGWRTPRDIWVNTQTLDDLLKTIDAKIDFLNLDVEGLDAELLLSFDSKFLKTVKVICCEQTSESDQVAQKLHKIGFIYSHKTFANQYFINQRFFDSETLRLKDPLPQPRKTFWNWLRSFFMSSESGTPGRT